MFHHFDKEESTFSPFHSPNTCTPVVIEHGKGVKKERSESSQWTVQIFFSHNGESLFLMVHLPSHTSQEIVDSSFPL